LLCCTVFLFLRLAVGPAVAETGKQIALVIGNGDYLAAPRLDNPTSDARAVAALLRRLGLRVIEGYDLSTVQMRTTIAQFSSALAGAETAVVYYAGHGISVDDENYLLPIDITLKSEADLDFSAFSLSLILRQMRREQRVNIIILDACRDNPFAPDLLRTKTRAAIAERGLTRVEGDLARGALIAFASDPKSTALDGKAGEHSPFTKALLNHLADQGVSIDTVMSRVRKEVWDSTNNQQLPWVNTSIVGEFELNPASPAPPATSAPAVVSTPAPAAPILPSADRQSMETLLWESAQHSNLVGDYQAYLDAFPNGFFAPMARNRIAVLSPPPATKSLTPATADPTAALRSEVGTEESERALNLSAPAREELQRRLIALNFNVGPVDGNITEADRAAIREWQESRKLAPTGFLGPLQYASLKIESEPAYRKLLVAPAKNPNAAPRQTMTRPPDRRQRLMALRPPPDARPPRPRYEGEPKHALGASAAPPPPDADRSKPEGSSGTSACMFLGTSCQKSYPGQMGRVDIFRPVTISSTASRRRLIARNERER
jgi:uncharacterized caspase-like protein